MRGAEKDMGTLSKPWARFLPELVILALCVVFYIRAGDLRGVDQGPGPAAYPRLVIILLAIAMFARLGQHALATLRYRRATQASKLPEEHSELDLSLISNARVWQAIGASVAFVAGTIYLGWLLAVFVFVPLFLYMAGRRNLLLTIPLGAVFALGFAYVFVKIVYIALPTGIGIFDEITVQVFLFLGIY